MIEFSLVLSVLLLLTLGTIDVARFVWAYNEIENAVDITARCKAVDQYNTCPNPQTYFDSFMNLTSGTVITSGQTTCGIRPDGVAQQGYSVTATYNFTPVIWKLSSTTISVSRCYPLGLW